MPHRPLSPHLQIYKPQLTSVGSILHRFSGIALCVGYIHVCLWIGLVVLSPAVMDSWFSTPGIRILWYALLWLEGTALAYHTLNGLRHLVWDTGKCMTLCSVERSAKFVFALTILISVVFAAAMLTMR